MSARDEHGIDHVGVNDQAGIYEMCQGDADCDSEGCCEDKIRDDAYAYLLQERQRAAFCDTEDDRAENKRNDDHGYEAEEENAGKCKPFSGFEDYVAFPNPQGFRREKKTGKDACDHTDQNFNPKILFHDEISGFA